MLYYSGLSLQVVITSLPRYHQSYKKKERKSRRERGFQTAESEGKGKNRSKRLAGYVREHECRAVPVVGKGENILLSLCVSCGRWDGEQLMAFHVITYLRLPLHSYLDPLFDRTLFFLVLKHSHDPLSSAMKSFCTFFFSSLFKLFHNFLPSLHYFIYESCRAVNLGKPASFTLTKHR